MNSFIVECGRRLDPCAWLMFVTEKSKQGCVTSYVHVHIYRSKLQAGDLLDSCQFTIEVYPWHEDLRHISTARRVQAIRERQM